MIEKRYFDEEMAYLREAGRYFASRYPQRAADLALDSPEGADPHVERLIESFAFLTARIRQRIDGDLPELCGTLLSLMVPALTVPIPAMTMLEFEPDEEIVTARTEIPRGAIVQSEPIGEAEVQCVFRTSAPVNLYPLRVSDVKIKRWPGQLPFVRVSLSLFNGIDSQSLEWDRLRFLVVGDIPTRSALYEALQGDVARIAIRTEDEEENAALMLAVDSHWGVTPFRVEEALLPQPEHAVSAFRVLQEYFVFPDRFRFFELSGLDRLRELEPFDHIHVDFHLLSEQVLGTLVNAKNIRLFCVPAVNLFEAEGVPIVTEWTSTEYRLEADLGAEQPYEVYSVESVTSLDPATGREVVFPPFLGFLPKRFSQGLPCYQVDRKPGADGRSACWLRFVIPEEAGNIPSPDILSVQLTCTNGDLPTRLSVGDVHVPGDGIPESVRVRNLSRPTSGLPPPLFREKDLGSWGLLAHVSSNLLSLTNAEIFRGTLELFASHCGLDLSRESGSVQEPRRTQSWRRRIDSIVDIRAEPAKYIEGGSVIPGTRVIIEVSDQSGFEERGEMLQFMDVMAQFLNHYSSINSFVELEVRCRKPESRRVWPWKKGTRPIL